MKSVTVMTKFSNCLSEDVDIGDIENIVFKAIKDMKEVYLAAQGALYEKDKERKSLLKEFEGNSSAIAFYRAESCLHE